jgi:DNA-directed RNA polymerase subunit beta
MIFQRTPVKSRERKVFTDVVDAMELPDLIEVQRRSYQWFFDEGISELFQEVTPIKDFIGRDLELYFDGYYLDEPKFDEKTSKLNKVL